jgi:hypothetical protein
MSFHYRFSENTHIPNFMTVRLVGAELFYADGRTVTRTRTDRRSQGRGRTDGHKEKQTGITKLTVGFRNFFNAPKKGRQ